MCFSDAKWIWAAENWRVNDWVIFRHVFRLEDIPRAALLRVYVDTKYYLWVNERLVVFDGGLFRESTRGNGYYDEVDIAPYLQKGKNVLAFKVWYFGNGGRNNVSSGAAGLLFESSALKIASGKETLCLRDPAHYQTTEENPSYIYGGHNIGYNSNFDVGRFYSMDYAEEKMAPAEEIGKYPCAPWNLAEKRPIPLIRFSEIIEAPWEQEGEVYTICLPYGLHFTPWFRIEASGGEKIDVRSDRYITNGGPGDEAARLAGHRGEYIARKGIQEFEFLDWAFGEKIIYKIPRGVKVLSLGYRESGYDADICIRYRSENPLVNRLLEKCARTLYVCMRENFMDCPDRERGQWMGDVSAQAPQVFYALSDAGKQLLRKAVFDFIRLRKGDVLVGNVPGIHAAELTGQILNAVSEYGLIAVYYRETGDKEVAAAAFEPLINYLKLWEQRSDGTIETRKTDWNWVDHNYNIDFNVIENAWYYSALKFCKRLSEDLGDGRFAEFLDRRIASVARGFRARFWKGNHFAEGAYVDDRANALAVICGLARASDYEGIRKVLVTVFNSTPYMEYYVLEALCQMGYFDDAYDRMLSRYNKLILNENSTLWEDFYLLGTRNHAWSGGPLVIVSKYFQNLNVWEEEK